MIKKINAHIWLIILLPFVCWLHSCSDNSDINEKAAGQPVNLLPGRWKVNMILTEELNKLKQKSIDEYRTLMAEMVDSSYMDFQVQDSIYIGRFGPDLTGGKWQVSDDSHHIIITDMTGAQEVMKIMRISNDSLILLNISAKSGITIELSR